jgi:hypothetical protein
MFLLAFGLFLLATVATFILMEMRHSASQAEIQTDRRTSIAPERIAISIAGASPLIVLQILVGAAVIFFLLPRVSGGYLSAFAIRNELATGFSDRVELGQIGQIQQSSAVVMHIQIDGDRDGASDLKWRGVALNLFDGRVWSNSHAPHPVPRAGDGRFLLTLPASAMSTASANSQPFRRNTHIIHYRVLMEPTGSNVFFLAPQTSAMLGQYRQVLMDRGGAVFDFDTDRSITSYEAWSDTSGPPTEQLRAAGIVPSDVRLEYLQLPTLDPRVAQLARSLTGHATNDYDRAAAIEKYLLTHFTYTLQLSRTSPRDPVAEFLFVRKQGHCEYFAASMAVMLRTLGIPSRVVNGFRLNEFNDVTGQYVVRDSDAHSWVEAYFAGSGWVSFDPTPAGSTQSHTAWSRILLYADALQTFWRERVIEYDANQQIQLSATAIMSGRRLFFRTRRWFRLEYAALLEHARRVSRSPATFLRGCAIYVAAVIGMVLGLMGSPRALRALRQWSLAAHPAKSPSTAAELWYAKMSNLLARKGWKRLPTQTPGEFARRIESEKLREQVTRFTFHYYGARFGASADDAQMLPSLYEDIAASARR